MRRGRSAPLPPCLVGRDKSRDEAMALVARHGGRGREVWVPCGCLPVLLRAHAPVVRDRRGRRYFRFRPARRHGGGAAGPAVGRLLALLAFLAATPLFLLTGLLLWLAGPAGGPGERRREGLLFLQPRRGQGRSTFRICKFRTLSDGHAFPLGRWLRSHGIDELPQLWNIVRGEMNWFGPRPLPEDDRLPGLAWLGERFSVRPGLTGLYQCCRGRREIPVEDMAVLDIFWIRNASPRFNALLLAGTVASVLGGWGREEDPAGRPGRRGPRPVK